MITTGVDLAAEARGTAAVSIDWTDSAAVIVDAAVGVDDAQIVAASVRADAVGIDCAFGWPDDFVEFVTGHAAGRPVDLTRDSGLDWRRRLSYRETDRFVRDQTGRWPLSAATDRLGLTAMHCAALLDVIGAAVGPVDRAGRGPVAEVYPAAALRMWGLSRPRYKVDAAVRDGMLDSIRHAAPWLDIGSHRALLVASDDVFDAMIAALISRAHAMGEWMRVPPAQQDRARREGWIVLPTVGIGQLLGG